MNYLKNPDKYHKETELCYYQPLDRFIYHKDPSNTGNTDPYVSYTHTFIVPNGKKSYSKDINARMPAVIYGFEREHEVGGVKKTINIPSPITPVYTNVLECMVDDINNAETLGYNNLKWKYLKLDNNALVDGIEYGYVTSNWYILTLANYPMIEKPLINVNDYSCYFMTLKDAANYIEQLIA